MSLFRHEKICLESRLSPEEFTKRLEPFVEDGTQKETMPHYSGLVGPTSFDLKYLLQPSYVKGEIISKAYGSDINVDISLTRRHDALLVFAYLAFTLAAFLVTFGLIGAYKLHRPITLAGVFISMLWFSPSLAIYYICSTLLKQAHRWNEIFMESLLETNNDPEVES